MSFLAPECEFEKFQHASPLPLVPTLTRKIHDFSNPDNARIFMRGCLAQENHGIALLWNYRGIVACRSLKFGQRDSQRFFQGLPIYGTSSWREPPVQVERCVESPPSGNAIHRLSQLDKQGFDARSLSVFATQLGNEIAMNGPGSVEKD